MLVFQKPSGGIKKGLPTSHWTTSCKKQKAGATPAEWHLLMVLSQNHRTI